MSRVAIFGGTFNPIHNGHILCASECMRQTNCEKVIFVPSNIPPHKTINSRGGSSFDRLEMCRIAIREYCNFEISDFEIKNNSVSYTVNTLEYFAKKLKNTELFFLMGQDMFLTLLEWKNPMRIFELAYICVVRRYESELNDYLGYIEHLKNLGARFVFLNIVPCELSSTFIRKCIKGKKDVSKYLPDGVEKYIKNNGLYI